MGTTSQRRLTSTSLLLLALGFIAAVVISNEIFKGWRVDFTEDDLYTLSDGTRRILETIDEPINLYFYFSDRATEDVPSLRSYAGRVRDLLEEIEDEADGKIRLSVIDPLPFSEEEDRATQFRLQGIQLGNSPDPVYMGLAATNAVGDEEVIAFFQPDKEEFLEYDVARLISTLAQPERSSIGLISGVRLSGNFDPMTQRMGQPWVVYSQAQQLFEIQDLGTDVERIDEDIGLLWIVQPKDLPDATLYAIDQFLMRGGRALIFVDPLAEADPAESPPGMPAGMPQQGQGSDLPKLFDAWGVEYSAADVVVDAELALPVSSRTGRPVRHLGLLGATARQLNQDEVITGDLEAVNLGTAGHVGHSEGGELEFEPLITSSSAAATLPASRFSFLTDPGALRNDFAPTGEQYVLAARLSGRFPSAFPDGPPAAEEAEAEAETGGAEADGGSPPESGEPAEEDAVEADEAPEADEPAEPEAGEAGESEAATGGAKEAGGNPAAHLAEAAEQANVIIVADVDILSDRLWVNVQEFFGQSIANAFADNGAFVTNSLDNLSGSDDLIDVRSRASYSRPFTRVEELRVQAEARFHETEERLQRELEETERRLSELQSSREDTGNILMTEEQQAEIDRFIDRRAEIRQELRAVQRDLDRNIERLGTILKAVNIGLVPLLLTVFVLLVVWRNRRRRPL